MQVGSSWCLDFWKNIPLKSFFRFQQGQENGYMANYTVHIYFLPAESVCHDSNAEGAHHAAHTKDGNRNAPDNGTDPLADWFIITLQPRIIEESS